MLRSALAPSRRLVPLLAALLLVAACGSSPEPRTPPGTPDLDASVFDTPAAQPAASEKPAKSAAVTHLGREVLPGVGLVVRGRTRSLSTALGGVEVARFEVEEVLRSVPWDRLPEDAGAQVLTVFCGEPGMLPRTGAHAALLVARRPRSPNHDAVQVIDLEGRLGPERLEALRAYLAVEEVGDESERVDALLAYLRSAVRDRRKWTRANAAREYGSFARARPDDLGGEDATVLRTAVLGSGEMDIRIALQVALEVAERNTRTPVGLTIPGAADDGADTADLDELVQRYLAAEDPMARRQVVIDGAIALENGATPLLRKALEDDDPRVREAAVASAGQLGLRSLGPDLVPMLAGDEPGPVVRSLVRSLGYLREPGAVPTLQALARGPGDLADDACYALARIRDGDAVTALGALLSDATEERRDLLEFLLSDAFVEQESQLGRRLD